MDCSEDIQQQVRRALEARTPLRITGGNSKAFLCANSDAVALGMAEHHGILEYEPTELVVIARSGTKLLDIQQILKEKDQQLAFDPPVFNGQATLGGTLSCNMSGPRRPYTGAARDFVLGTTAINGFGEKVRFGGKVMKNVAGYDLSKLLTGSFGTLGVILDAAIKVLPLPKHEISITVAGTAQQALECFARWQRQSLPITAACHSDDVMYVRLSGSEPAVKRARLEIGGELCTDTPWHAIQEWQHDNFSCTYEETLWRIIVPPAVAHLTIEGRWLIDWGGALRWLKSNVDTEEIRLKVNKVGGFAYAVKGMLSSHARQNPVSAEAAAYHQRIKNAFDPHGLFNPGIFPLG